MSVFDIVSDTEIVGYSIWEADPFYTPVVGCFVDGMLESAATCGLSRIQIAGDVSTLRWRSRVKRLLKRLVGRPVSQPNIMRLSVPEPDAPAWFRMRLRSEVLQRIKGGDPAVRLERLEDSRTMQMWCDGNPVTTSMDGPQVVEALLEEPWVEGGLTLDGFPAFLTAPAQFQLEVVFVEYLRRLPEVGARDTYLPALQNGQASVLDLRGHIIASDEFKARRIGRGSKLGASLVSPTWRNFSNCSTPLGCHTPLNRIDLTDWNGATTEMFLKDLCLRMLRRPASEAEMVSLRESANRSGRRDAALVVARLGARQNIFTEVV